MLLDKLRNLQIEPRIIHQDDHIRLPTDNVLLAKLHIPEDGAEMQQHRNETHVSQLFIMLDTSTSHFTHQVTSKKAEIGLRIPLLQGTHQIGRMQVARSLAYNQIILHTLKFQFRNSSIIP